MWFAWQHSGSTFKSLLSEKCSPKIQLPRHWCPGGIEKKNPTIRNHSLRLIKAHVVFDWHPHKSTASLRLWVQHCVCTEAKESSESCACGEDSKLKSQTLLPTKQLLIWNISPTALPKCMPLFFFKQLTYENTVKQAGPIFLPYQIIRGP